MIKLAGIGIAMGNAAPDVMLAADAVVGTNDEDGAADEAFSANVQAEPLFGLTKHLIATFMLYVQVWQRLSRSTCSGSREEVATGTSHGCNARGMASSYPSTGSAIPFHLSFRSIPKPIIGVCQTLTTMHQHRLLSRSARQSVLLQVYLYRQVYCYSDAVS